MLSKASLGRKCCPSCKAREWHFDNITGFMSCLSCGAEYGPFPTSNSRAKKEKTEGGVAKSTRRNYTSKSKVYNKNMLPGFGHKMHQREISINGSFYNPAQAFAEDLKDRFRTIVKSGPVVNVTDQYVNQTEVVSDEKRFIGIAVTLKRDIRKNLPGFWFKVGLLRKFVHGKTSTTRNLYPHAEKLYKQLMDKERERGSGGLDNHPATEG